jgi:DNA-binding NarL/FixJ family response regulator
MYFNDLVESYDRSRAARNSYHDLMRYRVREVLLVASLYESFIIESDGVLTEQIYGEYFKLHLNTVPRITCAYTSETALEMFEEGRFDLVVLVAGLDFDGPLALARSMKDRWPGVPVLLMVANNTSLAALYRSKPELGAVDRVFVWNGYSKLFVGMLKQVEDLRNVDADTRTGLVRVILLIEDSVRYYSRYLPLLFQVVQRQAQALIEAEKGVETHKLLRARARPKILLASSYEEAVSLFDRYEPYILTVISDVRFPRAGAFDAEAGFAFLRMAKQRISDLPIMIQSSEEGVRERALSLGAAFADKGSASLERELGDFLHDSLGFGPFMFRMPNGAPVAEARDIDEFMGLLQDLPEECLLYHAGRNDISTWLTARGEARCADRLKPYKLGDFGSPGAMRDFIVTELREARAERSRGSIPYFDASSCRDENCLSRLADGSVGGKGRGIIFIKSLLENLDFSRYVKGIDVKIPRTSFIGIDEFELFLESNGMWSYAFYESAAEAAEAAEASASAKDEELRDRFLRTGLSKGLEERLSRFVAATDRPLAVRSSGLFEDMLQVPFSGIYETYIIPNSHPDLEVRLGQLCQAVKLIYASLFSRKTRAYFEMAGYALEEERMGVVVQELVGARRGRWYYPHVSGTAQSYNYYPVSYLKPEDGLCVSALGLGSYVVGGGPAHRFCPKYPKLDVIPPERLLESSQRVFRALDMEDDEPDILSGDEAALRELDIEVAEADPRFGLLASTWDMENDRLSPGVGARGPRLVDLANILKHEALPFAQTIAMVLDMGARSMGTPVEIEYALNLDEPGGVPALYLLQLKPLIRRDAAGEGRAAVEVEGIAREECFIYSDRAMGNGRDSGVTDVVWVDPRSFDRAATVAIASEIEELDRELRALGRRYVLIGPGRWGTRDRWLGIPVAFTQISMARVIVEADLPEFKVESSLGSHFFHNVTSMNIGYFTVPWHGEGYIDWDWLYAFEPERRTAHCSWTRLPAALEILMDGRKSHAVVRKARASDTGAAAE